MKLIKDLEAWADMAELAGEQGPWHYRSSGINQGRAQAFREAATHLRATLSDAYYGNEE